MILQFTQTYHQQTGFDKLCKEKDFARATILVNYSNGKISYPAKVKGYITNKMFYCLVSVSAASELHGEISLFSGGKCEVSEENFKHWAIQDALTKAGITLSCSLPDSNIDMSDIERDVLKAIARSLNLENYDILTVLP
jgi:hypothetical protein